MGLSEQYTCACSQLFLDKQEIRLMKTKNGSDRIVSNVDPSRGNTGSFETLIRPLERTDRSHRVSIQLNLNPRHTQSVVDRISSDATWTKP